MNKRVTMRFAAWSIAGVLGAGAIGGVAYAASSGSASASGHSSRTTAGPHKHRHFRALGPLARRLEHGTLVLRSRRGDVHVDVQRGAVQAVSGSSMTVKTARDGFLATYALTPKTHVRVDRQRSSVTAIHVGDPVLVVAVRQGTTDTARRVVDVRHAT